MNSYLIQCPGFIGDQFFASSVADALKEWKPDAIIDMLLPVVQPKYLLEANPNIRHAFFGNELSSYKNSHFISLPTIDQSLAATLQFQRAANIPEEYWQLSYRVWDCGNSQFPLPPVFIKPVLGVVRSWPEKSFKFTREEYAQGIDTPNLGYGGKKHDIEYILKELRKDFQVILFGLDANVSQHSAEASNPRSFANMAWEIKYFCDFFLGPEGGLTNLAAGAGVRTAITTDFIWQLYGPNGIMRKIERPAMGPRTYFPNNNHLHIQPFADEDEIISTVRKWALDV